jgi:Peptidase M15
MKVRVLSTLFSVVFAHLLATGAEARVDTAPVTTAAIATGADVKPNAAVNTKADFKNMYALATTSDAPMSLPGATGKRTSVGMSSGRKAAYYGKKKYSKSVSSVRTGKKKYVSRKRSYASRGDDGGSSRSCLQPAARALLSRIESRFGSVDVISTCRAGAVIATTGKPSKHRYGLAIDFSAPGRKGQIVQWLIANHHSGGTMTYSDMGHIHVDVGAHFVQLGANSGHG